MSQRAVESFRDSRIYAVAQRLWGWTESSLLFEFLSDERLLFAGLAGFVSVSVLSVFVSNLGAGIKFLSFALFFVCLAVLVDRVIEVPE